MPMSALELIGSLALDCVVTAQIAHRKYAAQNARLVRIQVRTGSRFALKFATANARSYTVNRNNRRTRPSSSMWHSAMFYWSELISRRTHLFKEDSMASIQNHGESRVAVLVDCDNVSPDVLEHALKVAAQFGRIVVRRGYGNHGTLANKWQEALVRLAFTPCLQFQYAAGKNTSDIALALDAQETLFDNRADLFCLVTSDSDFAYLCRKLRERGAAVCIVGESKTPPALRNASDQFFEWRKDSVSEDVPNLTEKGDGSAQVSEHESKESTAFVVEAVSLLAGDAPEGKVTVSAVGFYLKRRDPSFSPSKYGFSGLLEMMKAHDSLNLHKELGGHWTVSLQGEPVTA